jgi:TM2 domain-containing membrane protein YozV
VNAPSVPTKSTGVAYLLWFFFGGIGAHKFYLGRPGVGLLYIGMFLLFWTGLATLLGIAMAATEAVLAVQQGNYSSPGLIGNGFGPRTTGFGMLAPGMVVPLSLALLYDLITMPTQVRAANARLGADGQQTFGARSAGLTFDGTDREAELAAKKADELVARYIARQSQSTPPARAAQGPRPAGVPTFGRRGR